MSNKWDYKSCLETTTCADLGLYDQVIALSQGLINKNFQKLYDAYPDLLSNRDSHGVFGKFKGKVPSPVILISGADQPRANSNEMVIKMRYVFHFSDMFLDLTPTVFFLRRYSLTTGALKDSDENTGNGKEYRKHEYTSKGVGHKVPV